MMSNNQNIFSERKVSNSSMISTSLNGPIIRQRSSIRNNDINSKMTKKEWPPGMNNNKININNEVSLRNELEKLTMIYYNKKVELSEVMEEVQKTSDKYNQKFRELESKKIEYDVMRNKNLNLKLMIMNMMKVKEKNKEK